MFNELAEELLDLEASVRGYGAAVFAQIEDVSGCSSSSGTVVLCCTCTNLPW